MEIGEVTAVVNTNKEFDTDWGTRRWDAKRAFRVIVTPHNPRDPRWAFFVFIPECPDHEVGLICQEMIDTVLDQESRDLISIVPVSENDIEDADILPVLAFHPMDQDVYLWLRPPRWLTN